MGQAQINVRIRACSRTSIARTKQAALTHNVRGKELKEKMIEIFDCKVIQNTHCLAINKIHILVWKQH